MPRSTASAYSGAGSAGILAKLEVAAVEVCPGDYPVARRLIASAARDLRRLGG